MAVVETHVSVWEALAGRAPGQPVGPADPGLWSAVAERLNPARAKPVLRAGIEQAELVSVRDVPYVMLRSPDGRDVCYLRLAPEEWALARLMDGTRTVARLVAEFAKITGRLAPDQVTRVVADLAGNRMLRELPVDAFRRLEKVHRRPWPARLLRGLLAFARGRRLIVARVDPLVTFLYKAGGRLFFTRFVAVLVALVALIGLGVFGWSWLRGAQPVFLTGRSYVTGALVLLGLNVLALACHELGHALATKHAGRRVPMAGFLVYFGIPSVFVDTTDVWMAGRRARLVTTAAGPATGLFLAGVAQVVGLVDPALAPWTFKLSFAWYVNVAFNLNPFLALDGYYLLMDWLEVPNLRARGLAWVVARLRRRPPRFGQLDREGRLVALYGLLSVAWLAIAANLAYRVYVDRVDGLITGLWRGGWLMRLLLAAVVAGLAAPMVWVLVSWLNRRWHRMWQRLGERRVGRDAPRREDALLRSALGQLPGPTLTRLAGGARWVHPRTGEQLVFAGAAQPSVFVVVDGALEGRRPGDPTGTVRERVGAGGVVGLAGALTGAASALAWYTAGTRLLAIPSAAVAATVGFTAGHLLPGERAELEALFDFSPALAQLSTEDRLGLVSRARPVGLGPGEPLWLGPLDAAVLAAGALSVPGGEARAGQLVVPSTVDREPAGYARTPVRAWILPAVAGLPLLLGPRAARSDRADPGHPPGFGVHPPSGYPPLTVPPGPPPSTSDDSRDRRFERKLWWLLLLLLLFALLLTGMNFFAGPAWSEMPADQALLQSQRGVVEAVVDGRPVTLHKGDKVYVSQNDSIAVHNRSNGRLTFRGGGYTVLCGGSQLDVGSLASTGYPVVPVGGLNLRGGELLADTTGTSSAFVPLGLTVASDGARVANDGAARFAVGDRGVDVSVGTVSRDGQLLAATDATLTCGDGTPLPPPVGQSPSTSDTSSTEGLPSGPGVPSSAAPTAVGPTTGAPTTGRPTTGAPTTRAGSPTRSPTRAPSPTPTRDTTPPVIVDPHLLETLIAQNPPEGASCSGQQQQFEQIAEGVYANDFTDPDDATSDLTFSFTWTLNTDGTHGSGGFSLGDGIWSGGFLVPYAASHAGGGTVTVTIIASDPAGNRTTSVLRTALDACTPVFPIP